VKLRAPFPWFGGKSKVSNLVWDRFGDVRNYVEPFAGSLAVLLARPTEPKIETVNDLDCWISNFWRSLQADPESVAHHADWPVNEADLHARHLWLVKQTDFRERMKTDPDYFDAKIAGWWVWGISQWIGSGWCQIPGSKNRQSPPGDPWNKRPELRASARGTAKHSLIVPDKRPYLTNHGGGMGVHGGRKRPRLGNDHGRGVLNATVPNQIPDLSGDGGAAGRGIHASAFQRSNGKMQSIGGRDWGINSDTGMERREGGLYEWMYQLSDRLRRVRVCCGDWKRILGPAPTTCIGTTAVFLDPPYAVEDRADVYGEESRDVAHDVREWALANGDNPELRIALCGYDTEHKMPDSWTEVAWKANGGFANQKAERTRGKENAHRERIWFSPYCLTQDNLFSSMTANCRPSISQLQDQAPASSE
jgi:site-specific DNA-adenine methylase